MISISKDDRNLPIVRILHLILACIVFPFFVGLTFFPMHTDKNFAWPLTPPMSCALFGSLYLAVAYSFVRVGLSDRWHRTAMIQWATLPVLSMLGVVTLMHWEKFTGPPIPRWIWIVVYLGFPPILLGLILFNRRYDSRQPEANDIEVPQWIRLVSFALGLVFGAVGACLFIFPEYMAGVWPWPMKKLAAQAVACLFMAPAITHLIAIQERRWSALKVLTQSALIWFVAVVVNVVRYWPSFDKTRMGTWIWVAILAAEILFIIASYAAIERTRFVQQR
jgi:hypothetical protein